MTKDAYRMEGDGWCHRCEQAVWTRSDGSLMGHTWPDGTPCRASDSGDSRDDA